MIGLLQRVNHASVNVAGNIIGQIQQGLLVLIGIEYGDTKQQADRLLQRLLTYRVFNDDKDKMNLSVTDIDGGLLLVPQFTLPADTQKGTRPSFTPAASPKLGLSLFDYFVEQAQQEYPKVETGQFGQDMQVSLTNDGPVTFWLQVAPSPEE